jgi:hypothetical protein
MIFNILARFSTELAVAIADGEEMCFPLKVKVCQHQELILILF